MIDAGFYRSCAALLTLTFNSNVKLLVGELNFDIYVRHHRHWLQREERQRSREQDDQQSKED